MKNDDTEAILSRRNFLMAGGLAAGHLLFGEAPSIRGVRERRAAPLEVRMRTSSRGADVWFEPVGLRVEPGRTIRWIVDRGVHTSTAYHPDNGDFPHRMPEEAAAWDSGHLTGAGEAYEYTFRREGVYDYFCRPHEAAGMVGRIVVARENRTRQLELPGWDGGSRERELAPRGGDGSDAPDLPRAARKAFPSVTRILDEGRVVPDSVRTVT